MKKLSLAIGTAFVMGVTACSAGGGNAELEFRAEQPVLPGFELDTGLIPAGSQAQVRALATATGSLVAQARASAVGNELQPAVGSGRLELGAEIKLEVFVKLDLGGGIAFDEKVGDVDIAAPAVETAFEPFLLDGTASVTSTLEPGELLSVPLGAVPGGTLVLSLAGGSLAAEFGGICATVHEGAAQYRGAVTWSGTVDLSAMGEVDVPLSGKQSFGPLAVAIPIAPFATDLDLGVIDVATGAAVTPAVSPCDADPDSGSGGADAGGQDDDAGTGEPDAGSDVEPPATSLWSVEIVSAHVAAIPCDGMEWDPTTPAPDPKVAMGTPEGQWSWTSFKSDTFDPIYYEKVGTWEYQELRAPEYPTMFLIYDADPDGASEYVGITGSFILAPAHFDGAPHEVERQRNCADGQAGMSVRFRLVAED
jgi:hypothetical protein